MTGPEQDAYQKLNKLKQPQLKGLCAANKCPKSGSKAILVNRLLGFHTHGRKSGCPRCAHSMLRNARFGAKDNSKLELEFVDGQPVAIKCTHQKGVGAKCGYRAELTPATKATILDIPPAQLADPDGYLVGVGLQDTAGSAQAQESGAAAAAGLPAASAFGGGGTFAGLGSRRSCRPIAVHDAAREQPNECRVHFDLVGTRAAKRMPSAAQRGYHTSTSVAPQFWSPPQISPGVPR
eukprot:COSAG04_NODE_8292_length_995_cov_1.272321_2_plen_236_part_00